ncbi:MAG: hypothetical protein ACR2KM_08790 [Gemmatimonadaceae bacterium]
MTTPQQTEHPETPVVGEAMPDWVRQEIVAARIGCGHWEFTSSDDAVIVYLADAFATLTTEHERLEAQSVAERRRTAKAEAQIVTLTNEKAHAEARAETLEVALREARTPDMYGVDETTVLADDLASLDLGYGTIQQVWANKFLGWRWVAYYLTEADDYVHDVFASEAEARAAIDAAMSADMPESGT